MGRPDWNDPSLRFVKRIKQIASKGLTAIGIVVKKAAGCVSCRGKEATAPIFD